MGALVGGAGVLAGKACTRCDHREHDCFVYPEELRIGQDPVTRCAYCIKNNRHDCDARLVDEGDEDEDDGGYPAALQRIAARFEELREELAESKDEVASLKALVKGFDHQFTGLAQLTEANTKRLDEMEGLKAELAELRKEMRDRWF